MIQQLHLHEKVINILLPSTNLMFAFTSVPKDLLQILLINRIREATAKKYALYLGK